MVRAGILRREHSTLCIRRLLSCLGALYVFYCEFWGSQANQQLLLGVSTTAEHTIAYTCSNILDLIACILASSDSIQATMEKLAPPQSTSSVLYLDSSRTTTLPVLSAKKCNQAANIDYIYKSNYLQRVLKRALAGYRWNLAQFWIIVDCSYEGRLHSDTTVLKVFLLDRQLKTFTTFMLQTLSLTRPQIQRRTSGGVAMFTTTSIRSLYLTEEQVICSKEIASYNFSMGFTFPYEWDDFEPIQLTSLVPAKGQWDAEVLSTNEKFLFAGTTGIYRRSPEIQGSFNYFYWDLPPEPMKFAKTIQFEGVKVFKDSWGWFRCFLGLGISTHIGINTGIALLVMINLWSKNRILWIPDVYCLIQRRAALRALLLFMDCAMCDWWYPYQWAVNQGSVRNHWGGSTEFDEASRADGLMICLATVSLTGTWLHVRAELSVVVVIYLMCFSYRFSLINFTGLFRDEADAFIKSNYFENILPTGHGYMDLWAYHENSSTNFMLIANESMAYVLAACGSFFYVVLIRVWASMPRRTLSVKSKGPNLKRIVPTSSGSSCMSLRKNVTLPTKPTETSQTIGFFEDVVGFKSASVYGLVAPTVDYMELGQIKAVSPSGMWLLGYIVIQDRIVIKTNDYIYLLLNAVLRTRYFNIYGIPLLDDSTIASSLVPLTQRDVCLKDLLCLSITAVR